MATTRRDTDRIAAELGHLGRGAPTGGTARERTAWRNGFVEAAGVVADALYATSGLNVNGNRRFDRDRFLDLAGARRSTPVTEATEHAAEHWGEVVMDCGICAAEWAALTARNEAT